jgi:signal peptidase II
MAARLKYLALITLVLAGLDQLTKAIAVASITPRGRIHVIPGFFDLVLWKNTGAAFGSLSGLPGGRWILVGITIIALAAAVWLALSQGGGSKASLLAIGLVCGGAVGNLIDRLRLGVVIDFLLFYYDRWYWPAFNLADSAITVGGVGLALFILRGK